MISYKKKYYAGLFCLILCLLTSCGTGTKPHKFKLKTEPGAHRTIILTITPLEGAPPLAALRIKLKSNWENFWVMIKGKKTVFKDDNIGIVIKDIVPASAKTTFEDNDQPIFVKIHGKKPGISTKIIVTGGYCTEETAPVEVN